ARGTGPAGAGLARAVLIALLAAGPLHALTLPLMELVHGDLREIDWMISFPAFNNVRRAGHLYTLSAAVGLGLVLWPGEGARARIAIGLLAACATGLVLWSGARGAWVALLLGCALAALHPRGPTRHVGALAACLALAVAIAVSLPEPTASVGLMTEIEHSIRRAGDADDFLSGRVGLWRTTLDLIGEAPLTGHGWGQFLLHQEAYPFPQVHSFPLELMFAFGVPMGLLAMGVLLALWLRAQRTGGAQGCCALMPLNTMAAYSLIDGPYFYGVPVIATGMVWGLCLAFAPAPSPEISPGRPR
ncbi:O-antigen ligase family protein, partial [Roseobacter sp. HKCCA0434]|uniref:O-antigen ligase family protein n=1 Tax=Roseobacter sp. HKCCA0434 TaxID=3079297 RepID=UPI002905A79D